MPESTGRKRIQIHLSTAVVLMFVSGGLIWLNTRIRGLGIRFSHTPNFDYDPNDTRTSAFFEYGWPYESVAYSNDLGFPFGFRVTFSGIAIDLGIALSILLAVWLLCEWYIRRRSAQKEP